MTHQFRRAVLAFTVFVAAGATHREAHAYVPTARTVCTVGCMAGSSDCLSSGGTETFCGGFAAGCLVGCNYY